MDEGIVSEIPFEVAIQICAEIRDEAEKNWHTAAARWCWECQKASGGDPAQRGFLRQPGNRGCLLVNARYSRLVGLGLAN